jgi:hypothetical protein
MTSSKTLPLVSNRLIQYAEPGETSSGDAFGWQLAFHRSPVSFKGFSGPVGSGKSQALCYEALNLSYRESRMHGGHRCTDLSDVAGFNAKSLS